jgi:ribonuclease III
VQAGAFERPSEAQLEALESRFGYTFADRSLLRLALTHRSYAFEAGGLPTNERLEFLGDAVLGLVVTMFIYRRFPDEAEGRLAKLRAAAVNTGALAAVGRSLGLGEAVLLGRGEQQSGGRDKDSILADTLEATIGAVYLDGGIERATRLVERLFADLVENFATRRESLDYKTSLQELTAARLSSLPHYSVSEEGPDHQKRFTAEVRVAGEHLGTGQGRSKKEAEQAAASEAYQALRQRLDRTEVPREEDPDAVTSESG